jgi:hypothetical protein
MNKLPIEIHNYINGFLQRTDQVAWKLTSKYYLFNLIYNNMNLNEELNLYVKNIDNLDYAWKDDTRYINIHELQVNLTSNYDLLKKYIKISNLWYFDFNAEFDVYKGSYIILFLTSVCNYTMNIYHIDSNNNLSESTHIPIKNKIKINFESKGIIKVNCREINKYKQNKTVQYMMCIPEYYWIKINKCVENNFSWKKQILCSNDMNKNIIVKF